MALEVFLTAAADLAKDLAVRLVGLGAMVACLIDGCYVVEACV